jgi:hypothetical protein
MHSVWKQPGVLVNRSLIFLSLERRQEREIQLEEMFWCASSLSQPLADCGICPVL